MDAVTYPDAAVSSFIDRELIPVQYNVQDHPDAFERFNSAWTPTLIVQDAEGREHRRTQGYLNPQRFLAEMSLALVNAAVNAQDWARACERSEQALAATEGDDLRHPEAIYWSGVAGYKNSGDVQNLLAAWKKLLADHPNAEWARRAEFIKDM